MPRSYGQHCALAHALDLIGERWTLLIVRELLASSMRYTELADGLQTIPSNLLAGRLREMETAGLIQRRRLAPPASSVVVYELTEDGAALAPAVTELARWGMRTLAAPEMGSGLRAHWLVLALSARYNRHAAAPDLSESYEFQIVGEEAVSLDIVNGLGTARMGAASAPAVRVTADGATLAALTSDTADQSRPDGSILHIDGEPHAIERMLSVLAMPVPE